MADTLQRKQTPLKAWHLAEAVDPDSGRLITVQEKMTVAISEILAEQPFWRPAMFLADGVWHVEFNADGPSRFVRAVAGDWLVIEFVAAAGDTPAGPELRMVTDADRASNYDVVEA
ncbi:hypothetical protein [Mycolicibacterium sphagni]|uniref:Uncharacterized protein n=1 Tax=Mycolicibacterium sphagni TaxID=1786 RepID=A0A255DTV3_9MYCO|nr:hypothetical protein [Mycolicibacterium sphagni]OYN80412.1 hypothetical protein CG716_09785 [Mycolicibacterium sphagni]